MMARRFSFPPPPPSRHKIMATALVFAVPMAILGALATLDSGSPVGPAGGTIIGAIAGAVLGARIGAIKDER